MKQHVGSSYNVLAITGGYIAGDARYLALVTHSYQGNDKISVHRCEGGDLSGSSWANKYVVLEGSGEDYWLGSMLWNPVVDAASINTGVVFSYWTVHESYDRAYMFLGDGYALGAPPAPPEIEVYIEWSLALPITVEFTDTFDLTPPLSFVIDGKDLDPFNELEMAAGIGSHEKIRYEKLEITNDSGRTLVAIQVSVQDNLLGTTELAEGLIGDDEGDAAGYSYTDSVVPLDISDAETIVIWLKWTAGGPPRPEGKNKLRLKVDVF